MFPALCTIIGYFLPGEDYLSKLSWKEAIFSAVSQPQCEKVKGRWTRAKTADLILIPRSLFYFFVFFLPFRKIVHRKTEKKVTLVVFFFLLVPQICCELSALILAAVCCLPAVTLPSSLSKLRRCEMFYFFLYKVVKPFMEFILLLGSSSTLRCFSEGCLKEAWNIHGHLNILPSIGIGSRIPWGWVGFFFLREYLDSLKVCNCFGTFQWK